MDLGPKATGVSVLTLSTLPFWHFLHHHLSMFSLSLSQVVLPIIVISLIFAIFRVSDAFFYIVLWFYYILLYYIFLLRASEVFSTLRNNISMSGPARPGKAWNAFERLISQQPLRRLTCGLLCWVAPSLLPHNWLLLMYLGDGRGTCHVKNQGCSRCSAEVAILRGPYLGNRWVDWLAVIFVR